MLGFVLKLRKFLFYQENGTKKTLSSRKETIKKKQTKRKKKPDLSLIFSKRRPKTVIADQQLCLQFANKPKSIPQIFKRIITL